eukprot:7175061-Prymnesium_polylepis.1
MHLECSTSSCVVVIDAVTCPRSRAVGGGPTQQQAAVLHTVVVSPSAAPQSVVRSLAPWRLTQAPPARTA